ncbi:MAG: 16S rRNA (uracil(1498)-N(3))-methyltransferase [Spirochaetales bacterium]|nr:16S rRNA (uracil(1498)-N(3))-methyltransferase [Spirochaetales bacterium]
MKQFLLPGPLQAEVQKPAEITVEGRDYHYLIRVRRFKEGSSFTAVDPAGNRFTASVRKIMQNRAILQLIPDKGSQSPSIAAHIILYQCLPKGRKMDTIIRQATEAGVAEIVPLISDFSISRPEDQGKEAKSSRWHKLCAEATQQSGRSKPPVLHTPEKMTTVFKNSQDLDLAFFFHQAPLENSCLHSYCSNIPRGTWSGRVGLLIGPEGGLSSQETAFLQNKGFKPVYLGPWILRTETAPVYALGAVQTILLERDAWQSVKEFHS